MRAARKQLERSPAGGVGWANGHAAQRVFLFCPARYRACNGRDARGTESSHIAHHLGSSRPWPQAAASEPAGVPHNPLPLCWSVQDSTGSQKPPSARQSREDSPGRNWP